MRMVNPYGCLDLAGIIFSLAGMAFVREPYTETDALWIGMTVAGFLMWGVHAWPRHGRPNLPVTYPDYTPRGTLLYGAIAWGALSTLASVIWAWSGVVELPAILLPAAAVMTGWRAFSLYVRVLLQSRLTY